MTFDEQDALVERLLRAGRADGPSAQALRAAPFAVGALLASTTAQAALAQAGVGVASEVGRAVSPLVLVKWIAVGTVAGSSLMALVHAPELFQAKSATKAAAIQRPTPSAAPAAAQAVLSGTRSEPEPEPLGTSSVAPGGATAPRQDVAREVALLDASRRALVHGDAAEALRLLATLERLPVRALAPEATVLRVRALLGQGKSDEARSVAQRFCDGAAASPQCAVLKTLLTNNVIQPPPSRL